MCLYIDENINFTEEMSDYSHYYFIRTAPRLYSDCRL